MTRRGVGAVEMLQTETGEWREVGREYSANKGRVLLIIGCCLELSWTLDVFAAGTAKRWLTLLRTI